MTLGAGDFHFLVGLVEREKSKALRKKILVCNKETLAWLDSLIEDLKVLEAKQEEIDVK